MKNFPEAIGLETNSSLQGGNRSEISNWGREVLNLKKDGAKIVKNLIFRTTLFILFNNCAGKCLKIPKMSLFKRRIWVLCFKGSPYCSSGIYSESVISVVGGLRILKNVEGKYSFERASPSVGNFFLNCS